MSTFVLVHGAWHGAWCWHKVVPKLEDAGHEVVTLDLPAHGTDTTPITDVTLADHVERVGDTLEDQDEQVILVGHSMGGVIITQTAEEYPEHIDKLVYLTAFLLDDGEKLLEYAETDDNSVVTANLVVDEKEGYATVAKDAIEDAFYADCSAADVTLSRSLLRPEPLAGLVSPVDTTEENFGSVPRIYIECLRDQAITLKTQRTMRENLPCEDIRTLDTSHSAFLSAPKALVDHLGDIA